MKLTRSEWIEGIALSVAVLVVLGLGWALNWWPG